MLQIVIQGYRRSVGRNSQSGEECIVLFIVPHHRHSPYACMHRRQAADGIPTVVGATVIYKDYFEGNIERFGNGYDSFDEIWQDLRTIIDRDKNRKARRKTACQCVSPSNLDLINHSQYL